MCAVCVCGYDQITGNVARVLTCAGARGGKVSRLGGVPARGELFKAVEPRGEAAEKDGGVSVGGLDVAGRACQRIRGAVEFTRKTQNEELKRRRICIRRVRKIKTNIEHGKREMPRTPWRGVVCRDDSVGGMRNCCISESPMVGAPH